MIGQKFGRLTVIEELQERSGKNKLYKCVCDCGTYKNVTTANLKSGRVKSCGCLRHSPKHTRLYNIWQHMRDRCYNNSNARYINCGGRGITICDEWLNDNTTFFNWAMDNGYRDNLTIDRIDNTKGYSPDNCRWVDRKIQNNNTRRNVLLTYNNKTQTITEWSKYLNISRQTIYTRYRKGYTDKECLFGKE